MASRRRVIKWHIGNIYKKLDANSKALVVVKAIRLGLVSLDTMPLS